MCDELTVYNSNTIGYSGRYGILHTVACLSGYELPSGDTSYQTGCDTNGIWEVRLCQGQRTIQILDR